MHVRGFFVCLFVCCCWSFLLLVNMFLRVFVFVCLFDVVGLFFVVVVVVFWLLKVQATCISSTNFLGQVT